MSKKMFAAAMMLGLTLAACKAPPPADDAATDDGTAVEVEAGAEVTE